MSCLTCLFLLLLVLAQSAKAQVMPKTGEIRLEGIIAAVAPDKSSFNLEVSAFTVPSGKSAALKVPKIRKVVLDSSSAIFPGGDVNWKLLPQSLRVGYEAQAVGSDGDSFTARTVELERAIEGKKVDYFVAQNGSDAADGSKKTPWRTVQKAVSLVPSGWEDEPCVLHIGVGSFAESFDGKSGQLRIDDKQNLILTGAGARVDGGTQIQTGDYVKTANIDVLRVSNCQNLEIRNLVVGDDKSWDQDRFFEATVKLTRSSKVLLQNVRIVGPSADTLLDADRKRGPTALRPDDAESVATLQNVLITGHCSFLSNPEGRVFCHRVTFARMWGPGYDDHFLFLQTPQRTPKDERRFTFEDCILYEMAGGRGGESFMMAGRDGEDKTYFDAPKNGQGGNLLVRCRYQKPDTPFQNKTLAEAFTELREGHFARIHGIFVNDDTNGALAGGLTVNNEIQLEKREGYLLTAPKSLHSGWVGGFSSPAQP
jgi:hypothetical protein